MTFAKKSTLVGFYIFHYFILYYFLVISEPNIIHLKRSEESLDNIKQYYVWCTAGDEGKFTALTNLYGVLTIGQCIVFCHVSGERERGGRNEFLFLCRQENRQLGSQEK